MSRRRSTTEHERTLLEELKKFPRTMQELSNDTGLQYYTVRRIIARLHEQKKVKIVEVRDRSDVYDYNGLEAEGETLPRLIDVVNKSSSKIHILLPLVCKKSTRGITAAYNFPSYITHLLALAMQADNKTDPAAVGKELDKIRTEMARDLLYAKNTYNFYKQVLQDERYWDVKTLKQFAKDKDFNAEDILEAVEKVRRDS